MIFASHPSAPVKGPGFKSPFVHIIIFAQFSDIAFDIEQMSIILLPLRGNATFCPIMKVRLREGQIKKDHFGAWQINQPEDYSLLRHRNRRRADSLYC
jgi:hypothetical protein